MNEATIIKTRTDRLYNQEHMAFLLEVDALIKATLAEILHADDLIPRFTARLNTLDDALKRIVKSQRTEQIHNADKDRDDTYRGLVTFTKAMLLHDNPAIREAAGRIMIVVDTYGSVLGMNYEKETATLYNLIQDLKSAKYAPDVAAVGLTPWVAKLEERNDAFRTLLNSRDQEAAAGSHIAVKDARLKLDKIYASFRNRVNSYVYDDEPNPALEAFVNQLNVISKRFNTLAARRRKSGKPAETDDEGDEDTGDAGGGEGGGAPEGDNQ